MKKSIFVLGIAAVILAVGSLGGAANAATAQQEKMKTCNAEAKTKNLAGDDRKTFMKTCLSATGAGADTHAAAKKLTPQQEKMKACNAEAKTKNLAGADRKTFMSTCLKG